MGLLGPPGPLQEPGTPCPQKHSKRGTAPPLPNLPRSLLLATCMLGPRTRCCRHLLSSLRTREISLLRHAARGRTHAIQPVSLSSSGSSSSASRAMASDSSTCGQRGAFILFEGIDRSGKTTQCSKLVDYLQAKQVTSELWRFPDRTTALGQMIDAYLGSSVELNDQAVHLMFSANRWEKSSAILKALDQGTTLVVDRYSFSGMAYSLAKRLPGVDKKWCQTPESGLPAPDLVFYMRSNPSVSSKRGGYGEERYEKQEFQNLLEWTEVSSSERCLALCLMQVSSNFDALVEDNWVVIEADQAIEAIHEQIVVATERLLSSGKLSEPLKTLYPSSSCPFSVTGEFEVKVSVNASIVKGQQEAAQQTPACPHGVDAA